ncbi:MAG: hypothetical protein AMS24_03920 [Chlamydiae bacterium SM23_39]|nr:MAG: hypothetical protein AMS24_03920 [Chlamydiae bacterium SM23_39]
MTKYILKNKKILDIEPSHTCKHIDNSSFKIYLKSLKRLIEKILPKELLIAFDSKNEDKIEKAFESFQKKIPLITLSDFSPPPSLFSFTIICSAKYSNGVGRFVIDMLCKWLIPGQNLAVFGHHSLNFKFSNFKNHNFFLAEFFVHIPEKNDLEIIKRNIKKFIYKLRINILSVCYARNILHNKSLSFEEKSALIYENMSMLLDENTDLEKNAFDQMQHFMFKISAEKNLFQIKENLNRIMFKKPYFTDRYIFESIYNLSNLFQEKFTATRDPKYVSKIISIYYLLKKAFFKKIYNSPNKRHLSIKIIKTNTQKTKGPTKILGIFLFINLLKNTEHFDKNHLLKALKSLNLQIQYVKDSFIEYKKDNTIIGIFSELKKENEDPFSLTEITTLTKHLLKEVEERIETMINPIFMPRNEEENFRNIILLSEQLKYVKDIAQVIISYDNQTNTHVIFNIILVRLLKNNSTPIKNYFQYSKTFLTFISEEVKVIGYLKNKYPKEANIFKIKLKKSFFYRKDSSLDLQKAREVLTSELFRIIGDFRDFNGGIILNQNQILKKLKQFFLKDKKELFLENFFYSIKPPIMQNILDLPILQVFFSLFTQILNQKEIHKFYLKNMSMDKYFLIVIGSRDIRFKEKINNVINNLKIPSFDITSCYLEEDNIHMIGYVFRSDNLEKHYFFYNTILNVLQLEKKLCSNKEKVNFSNHGKPKKHILKTSLQTEPLTLDPRKSGGHISDIILFMLFEGLTKFNKDGSISLCLAKNYTISKNKKKYTFYLKDNIKWSDGSEITSYDFKKCWEKILDPHFPSICTHLLYPIVNAEKIKQGKKDIKSFGVNCIDDKTLVINLNHPTPHFLSLTSFYIFFPLPSHVKDFSSDPDKFVCNGPFKLKKWIKDKEIILEKNPFYHNEKKISLDLINISIIDDEVRNLQMFENEKLDWINSLISPIPLENSANLENLSSIKKIGGTTFCAFNVEKFPFNNKNIRKAFSYAINRKEIIKALYQNEEQIATRCIPPIIYKNKNLNLIKDDDPIEAKKLFQKGLQELNINSKNLNIIFTFDHINKKLADLLIEKWEKIFNIKINSEPLNSKESVVRLHKKQFQLTLTLWSLYYNDPLNILERFKHKNYEKNYSNWENKKYISLLESSYTKNDPKKRETILEEAEKILIEEIPLFPIYHHNYLILANKKIKEICLGPLGEIYLDEISFKNKKEIIL